MCVSCKNVDKPNKQAKISNRGVRIKMLLSSPGDLLTQGSYVANDKATVYFSYIPTILTNALPGAPWVRDKETQ